MDLFEFIRDSYQTQHFNRSESKATKNGYYLQGGCVYSPAGLKKKLRKNTSGYFIFSFTEGSRVDGTRKKYHVLFHRFVAYQKYGDLIYNFECVRHLDGDKNNNSIENLKCGTHKQNMNDVPPSIRKKKSIIASSSLRKFSNEKIEEIREQHTSYKETMRKYGIKSKGTLWEILNREYVTEKAS